MELVKSVWDTLGNLFTAGGLSVSAILFVIAILAALKFAANRYKKIPPNKVGVIYGTKHKVEVPQPDGSVKAETVGFRLVTGGGAIIWPIFQSYAELGLEARIIPLEVRNVPNTDGVLVSVEGVATVSIGTEQAMLIAAARNFQGKSDDTISDTIRQNMEGQLRAIVGTMSIEQLIKDRAVLNEKVLEGAEMELVKLGVKIQILTIQNISDEHEYIQSLGKGKTAEVKREQAIRAANADRDTKVATSNAEREAATVEAENAVKVADAQKTRDVQVANFKKETTSRQAEADLAGALATAQTDRLVRQAKVQAEEAETEARTLLAQKEAARKEQELIATTIRPAEAAREATVINAGAARQKLEIEAEASKRKTIIDAEAGFEAAAKKADAIRIQAQADSDAAALRGAGEAKAIQAVKTAEAEGEKAKLLAVAEGAKQHLLAEAEGKRQSLLAQAEGEAKMAEALLKKAEALKALNEVGQQLMVLDKLPGIIEALGKAGTSALGPEGLGGSLAAMAAPMGQIDSVHLVNVGGNNNDSPLDKWASTLPNLLFRLISQGQALGFDKLLEKAGLSSELLERTGLTSVLTALAETLQKPRTTAVEPAPTGKGSKASA